MTDVFPDPSTDFGARVQRRLDAAHVAWLTTVGADGTPQPNPVWFLREGDTVLIYNQPTARRLAHVARNPRVALNLDSDGDGGGDIVVLTGTAEIVAGHPLAHEVPAYIAKYGAAAARISGDTEAFARSYGVAMRITVDRVRGF
jgi:PPOX class probable F420-dependent enzyme